MTDDTAKILAELARLRRLLRKPAATYNGPAHFPPAEVYHAALAAGKHTPLNHRPHLEIPVAGRVSHMQESVYGKVCAWLGLTLVEARQAKPGSPIGFVWKPKILGRTHEVAGDISKLRQDTPQIHHVNDTHFDDDKAVVQSVFEKVFGYALEVDPLRHSGPAVSKSRENATHDGGLVECPIRERSDKHVYQVLVNNLVDGDLVEDIRIAIINYQPVFCYIKYRPVSSRFSNQNVYAQLASVFDVCSSEELRTIRAFTHELGLEVGEIDALRDRNTGRIYIVDANNTPFGPPNNIEIRDHDLAVRWLSDAFMRAYLEPAHVE